uniref:NADH-ubiquinone oxidoreductase chain 1 n=1 Tax=Archipsocus nomas TaxID=239250 RepID=A0A343QCG0_9NEOP|nr:NADH dehydrogenase subunit 1 [Archipsocus nomas]ATU07107.1 NADH dehydrogenase subunit 1 [Archipsocus nomas]
MSKDLYSGLMGYVILIIMVLIGVAFLTLLERKVLGYMQIRSGPNKVGIFGMLQPFSDGMKLFSKESVVPFLSNYLIYYFSPVFSFFLVFFLWSVIPYGWGLVNFNFGFVFFLCCLSFSVYGVMIAGWSSNSMYALIGSLRSVAQTISYEVSLGFIFFCLLIMINSFSLLEFKLYQFYVWFICYMYPLFLMMFTSMLAETNRTPFDLAEGESELVSGFNVEYSSGGFALIFLAEYSSILLMSLMIGVMFLGGNFTSFFFLILLGLISFLFIWLRGTLPRYRYDKLMNLCWKSYLPVSLLLVVFYFNLKLFLILVMGDFWLKNCA